MGRIQRKVERKELSELHLFSALRTTLFFFDAYSDSTASAEGRSDAPMTALN